MLTYRLALPPKLSHMHDVFHVAMLRKNESDPVKVVNFNDIELEKDTTYIKEPMRITERE